MKKAIALLLALVMVFALCACGGGDKGTADNGEKVVKIGVFEPPAATPAPAARRKCSACSMPTRRPRPSRSAARPTRSSSSTPTTAPTLPSCLGGFQARQREGFARARLLRLRRVHRRIRHVQAGRHPGHRRDVHEPNVTAGNSHYFRICFLDPFQGTVLANYASSELKAKKAYCLGENGNEYDQGLVTFFKQAFEKPAAPSSPTPSRRTTPTSAPT